MYETQVSIKFYQELIEKLQVMNATICYAKISKLLT